MLNVNAKAFVPPGVVEGVPPGFIPNTWYRYRLNVPVENRMSSVHEERYLNSISSLLSLKYLYAERGGLDDDSLQYFLNQQFILSNNTVSKENEEQTSSGFLLSRSILTLYTDVTAVASLNDSKGLLMHLDLPTESNGDVALFLGSAWESFYAAVANNSRVSSIGYSRSVVGLNGSGTDGTHRHFFFAACNAPELLEPVLVGLMADCPVRVRCILPIKSVVPYICCPHLQLGIAITIGKEAKRDLIKNRKADMSVEIKFKLDDFFMAWREIERALNAFKGFLVGDVKWDKTKVLHLHIDASPTTEKVAVSICDVIRAIGFFSDDASASIVGVSFSSDCDARAVEQLIHRNKHAPFYKDSSLDEMLNNNLSLDTENVYFGGFPSHIKLPLPVAARGAAVAALELWQRFEKQMPATEVLTRMTFADAADSFARTPYVVRRKAVGSQVIIGTDTVGNVFGVDVAHNSVFGLPMCFGGAVAPIINCVFKGIVSSSYRNSLDYRVIIDDLLVFEGKETRGIPYSERLHMLSSFGIEDETTWPHANAAHIVILKAESVSFNHTREIVDTPVFDHNNLGIVFSPSVQPDNEAILPVFEWVPPNSLTARFIVENIESPDDVNEGFCRAFLGVFSSNVQRKIVIPYEGEYADYQREAYPNLRVGSLVECLLRRADDGAHWWDILKDLDSTENTVANSFDEVDDLVHSPGVTQEEMLWLLKAPSFQCERCHKVNDVGRRNNKHNAYWCKNCWIETGHGDCVYCGRSFALGMLDGRSSLFYCEDCWNAFSSTNTAAEVGYHVPPPPNATFTQQVTTRCVSLLIDLMNSKTPSNDVLDLCCGGSVLRKWMRNKTLRYVGIDLKRSVVDSLSSIIDNAKERVTDGQYDMVCGDVFSDDFWTSTIVKIHSRQFHVISCFAGLHHAFENEKKARHFLGSVANALVPGGTFLGTFIDASVLFSKGKKYSNSIMKATWSDDAVPRIGHTFQFTTNNGPLRDVNVIPIDFLIAVAAEYGLHAVSEAYMTFRELIEKDASWTKVPSADEKEYLCALRTFAFKKESNELAPSSPGKKSDSD
jgi:2-polyprenyl-3-methyl-5-hydroxy-6-metoxy-1,4-benzoquinol methylase